MASFTPEVEQFITQRRLGSPINIYGPSTILSIIGGLFLTAFALFWTWIASHMLPPTFPSDSPSMLFTILPPLIGLLIFSVGLWVIGSAIYNRNMRAVVCTYGVVFARPSGTDSFYWQDILTTSHKIDINVPRMVSRSYNRPTLVIGPNTTVRHTYTVHCHDGRKFIFKSPLTHIQDLREDIEVQVARFKQAQPPRRY